MTLYGLRYQALRYSLRLHVFVGLSIRSRYRFTALRQTVSSVIYYTVDLVNELLAASFARGVLS